MNLIKQTSQKENQQLNLKEKDSDCGKGVLFFFFLIEL